MIKIPREKVRELLSEYKNHYFDWKKEYGLFTWSLIKGMWYENDGIEYYIKRKDILAILNQKLNTSYKTLDLEWAYSSLDGYCRITYITLS